MKTMFDNLKDYHDLNDIDFNKSPYKDLLLIAGESISSKPIIRCMFYLCRYIDPEDQFVTFTLNDVAKYYIIYEQREFPILTLSLLIGRMLDLNSVFLERIKINGLYKLYYSNPD